MSETVTVVTVFPKRSFACLISFPSMKNILENAAGRDGKNKCMIAVLLKSVTVMIFVMKKVNDNLGLFLKRW
jgi:hypothetical protein